ncbi:MAG: uracil-DNA glycosylase family protein [Bacteroidales bacterium]|nr:uracil-DNA glycosylase family protein [Bacteroidales bacterium]
MADAGANNIPIERHPLQPFLPNGAEILMLGSFPPKRERWSMDFYYPNIQNDMWRIMGLIFYGDKDYFVEQNGKKFKFCYDKVVKFCTEKHIAIFDAASAVKRLMDNASDAHLEIVEKTDIPALLQKIPKCRTIVSTGGKSAETIAEQLGFKVPQVGCYTDFTINGKEYRFHRMPSSSRAFPMKLEKKAEAYRRIFE